MEALLNVVRTVAPTLATAVGGPLAGMATRVISEALLGKPDGTEQELAAAATGATPDQLLALKKADQDFAVRMRELEIDLERISQADRASARDREVKTGDWTPRLLAGGILSGYFGVLFYMLNHGLPAGGGSEAMLLMVGGLSTAFAAICAYYFGSSAGSREKNETISKMVKR